MTGRIVLKANGARYGIYPQIARRGIGYGLHTVALVAQIPGNDAFFHLHFAHERAREAAFPHQTFGVGQYVFALQHGRDEQPAAHPAGDDAHQQRKTVLFGQAAERVKVFHARFVEIIGRFKRRFAVHAVFARLAAAGSQQMDRLEIAPVGEDAQRAHAVLFKLGEVAVYGFLTPARPHFRSGMRGPVVASDKIGIHRVCSVPSILLLIEPV